MLNSFAMALDPPYTLNFLIYIQNIYLNQINTKENYYFKHPYISTKMAFKEDFEANFHDLFDELSQRLLRNKNDDLVVFNKEIEMIFQRLFKDDSESYNKFKEIYTAFQVWWGSYAGQITLERSIVDLMSDIYRELTNLLQKNQIKPLNHLKINLIYDECVLTNHTLYPYFATISVDEIIFKKEELVFKLQNCF